MTTKACRTGPPRTQCEGWVETPNDRTFVRKEEKYVTTMRTTQRTPARAIGLLVLIALASFAAPTVGADAEKNATLKEVVDDDNECVVGNVDRGAEVSPRWTAGPCEAIPHYAAYLRLSFRSRRRAGNVAKHRARIPKSAENYFNNADRMAGHNLLSRPSAIGTFGLEIPAQMTAEQAIEASGLDWVAQKKEAHVPTGKLMENVFDADGVPLEIPEMMQAKTKAGKVEQFTCHSLNGTAFGKVGQGYEVYQHPNAIRTVHEMLDEPALDWEFIAEYKGGANMAAALILPEDSVLKPLVFNNGGDDEVLTPYLAVSNSHDGKGALKFTLLLMRMWCWNAFSAVLGAAARGSQDNRLDQKLSFSLRHNQNIYDNVHQLENLLQAGQRHHEEYLALCEAMNGSELTEAELMDFFVNNLVATKRASLNVNCIGADNAHGIDNEWGLNAKGINVLNTLMDIHAMPQNNVGVMNTTVFGALQTLLDYEDHEAIIDNHGNLKETKVANALTDNRVKAVYQRMAIDVGIGNADGDQHLMRQVAVATAGDGTPGEVILTANADGTVTEHIVPEAAARDDDEDGGRTGRNITLD